MTRIRANETDPRIAVLEALIEWYPRSITPGNRFAAAYVEFAKHYLAMKELPDVLQAAELNSIGCKVMWVPPGASSRRLTSLPPENPSISSLTRKRKRSLAEAG